MMEMDSKAADRSAQEWFALAEKSYLEKHQGCVWCGGSHRVYLQRQSERVSYYCQACDCQVVYDGKIDRYQFMPGETPRERSPETMSSDGDLPTQQ
jgi:hypothetical protein